MNPPRGMKAAASLLNLIGDYSAEDFLAAGELLSSNPVLAELAINLARARQRQENLETLRPDRRGTSSSITEKDASTIANRIVSNNPESKSGNTPAPNQNPPPSSQTPVQLAHKFSSWFQSHYSEIKEYLSHPRFLPDGALSALTDLAFRSLEGYPHPSTMSSDPRIGKHIRQFVNTMDTPSLSAQMRLENILMLLEQTLHLPSDLFFRIVAITVIAISQNLLMFPSIHDILNIRRPTELRLFVDERMSAAFAVLQAVLSSSPNSDVKAIVFDLLRKALISPSDGPVSIIKTAKAREKK